MSDSKEYDHRDWKIRQLRENIEVLPPYLENIGWDKSDIAEYITQLRTQLHDLVNDGA